MRHVLELERHVPLTRYSICAGRLPSSSAHGDCRMAERGDARIPWSALTPAFVETRTGGRFLYCALHREWHSYDEFSGGSSGQCRQAVRYCLRATAEERATFEQKQSMAPSDEGRFRIADRLKFNLRHAPDRAPTAVDSRRQRAEDRGAGADASAEPEQPRPRRQQVRRSSRMRAQARAGARKPAESANSRIMKVWGPHYKKTAIFNCGRAPGGAVGLPAGRSMNAIKLMLLRLSVSGVLKQPKPSKLMLSFGLVEYITAAICLPQPKQLICGQAAIVSATGLELAALGVERWPPSSNPADNGASFKILSIMLKQVSQEQSPVRTAIHWCAVCAGDGARQILCAAHPAGARRLCVRGVRTQPRRVHCSRVRCARRRRHGRRAELHVDDRGPQVGEPLACRPPAPTPPHQPRPPPPLPQLTDTLDRLRRLAIAAG